MEGSPQHPGAARLAWPALAFFVLLAGGGLVLSGLNGEQGEPLENFLFLLVFTAMGTVGALVASRRAGNPIGWLFLGISAAAALGFSSDQYALRALVTEPGSLPGAAWAVWLSQWTWVATLGPLMTFLPLLFPTGRLPSRRWRPIAWAAGALLTLVPLTFALQPRYEDFHGLVVANPIGLRSIQETAEVVEGPGFVLFLALAIACTTSLFLRFRPARGEERQQIKWFAYAIGLLAAFFLISGVLEETGVVESVDASAVGTALAFVAFLSVPVAAGVAILRYRLYDIDLVIRKTLVFGALAAFATTVYVAIVVGIGAVVAGTASNTFLPLVAAVVIAVALQPVRARARHLANRLVYGKRATPYEVLSEFAERMTATYASEEQLPRMARILAEGTGAQRADVWLRVGDELRPASSWPRGADGAPAGPLPFGGGELPELPGVSRALRVRHHGELLGALAVTKPPSEPLTPEEDRLLAGLASQAGLVLRNARLTEELLAKVEELRASRQRIVAAQDEERRRIERDIHDGAQQQMVSIAVKLRLARTTVPRDPARADELLATIEAETEGALADLRDLARGIYPPLLADQGLPAALAAQARKAPLPVGVDADGVGRYPQEVEAAVYFCVLEALQNVAKYAAAERADVWLRRGEGELRFEVEDRGTGFDPRQAPRGTGLTNMSDRLAALGGELEVRSAPGEGTTVAGRIPTPAREPGP